MFFLVPEIQVYCYVEMGRRNRKRRGKPKKPLIGCSRGDKGLAKKDIRIEKDHMHT